MVVAEIIAKKIWEACNPTILTILAAMVAMGAIAYLVANTLSQVLFFKYTREKRKDLIDNGLGSSLLGSKSDGYFSNDAIGPGVYKLAVNCFENCHFSLNVFREMRNRSGYFVSALLFLFFASAFLGQIDVLTWIVKIPVLTILVVNFAKLCSVVNTTDSVYSSFSEFFINLNGRRAFSSDEFALAMKNILDYESLIAWSSLHLNSKIFGRLNSELSKQWHAIKVTRKIPV